MLPQIPVGTADYGRWWGTADGRWLYARIEDRIGQPVVHWAGRVYGPRYESLDVANTAVEVLSHPHVVRSLIGATDQWAYLAKTLKKELISQIGGFFRSDTLDTLAETTVEPFDDETVTVAEAVELTARCLSEHTPASLLPHLREIVYYFAEQGHANLSRLHSAAARDPELLDRGISPAQIRAVANAVLGSRPDHGTNSLLGRFLADSDYEIDIAGTRALITYGRRMTAANETRELVSA